MHHKASVTFFKMETLLFYNNNWEVLEKMLSCSIELRFANAEDIPDATEFVLLALNDIGMQNECVEILGSKFTDRLESYGPQCTLFAFDNNNNNSIIGFLEIDPVKCKDGHYFISNIYVLPSYRHQGIATRLVHKMLETKCKDGEELLVEACHDCDLKYWEKLEFTPKSTILSLKRQ